MDSIDWHRRFVQQAGWTKSARKYLIRQADMDATSRVLEVGCGTGAILSEFSVHQSQRLFGVDIDPSYLSYAASTLPSVNYTLGDGHHLPFENAQFDLTLSHFLLLWVQNPQQVIHEMARVTRKSGRIIASAEPDYGGRIDFPNELKDIGQQQAISLRKQGANPEIGRQLGRLFHQAGLQHILYGVIGGQWSTMPTEEAWETEWQVIAEDLDHHLAPAMFQQLKNIDRKAWQNHERVLYVPIFYAIGTK